MEKKCLCHEEDLLAACMDCEAFLCKECLLTHDLNERIAYFTDYLKDNYEIVSKLGEGGYGKVYKVRGRIDERLSAIKVLKDFDNKSEEIQNLYIKEVQMHAKLNHPNIIGYISCMKAGGHLFHLIELANGSIQSKFMQTFQKRKMAVDYILQVLEGVQYLHDQNIIHSDLKPSNILVAVNPDTRRETIKVCDFGSSRVTQKGAVANTTVSMLGTHGYMPPEYYATQAVKELSTKSDVWALGCIIHQILTNNHPFLNKDTKSVDELKHKVLNSKYNIHKSLENTIYSNIIQTCLRVNPRRRGDVKELLQAFKIIYSIYEKYSDEREAERILQEETAKIKSFQNEEEVTTTTTVSKRVVTRTNEEDSSEEEERPRRRPQGGQQIINKTYYSEVDNRKKKKKRRRQPEYYYGEEGGPSTITKEYYNEVNRKKKDRRSRDGGGGEYYEYGIEDPNSGEVVYRTVKKGEYLDLQGGRAVSKRAFRRGGGGEDDPANWTWEYDPSGKLVRVNAKDLNDGGEWYYEHGPNGEKVRYSRPAYMQKFGADPRILSRNAGGSKGPFLTAGQGSSWASKSGPGVKVFSSKPGGMQSQRSGQINYDGNKSMMANPKFKQSGPIQIGGGKGDLNRSAYPGGGSGNSRLTDAMKKGMLNKSAMMVPPRTQQNKGQGQGQNPQNFSQANQMGRGMRNAMLEQQWIPPHGVGSKNLSDKAHDGIVWKILPLNESQFVTCSNDKKISIWANGREKPLSTIDVSTPVNSVCACYVDDEPTYLVAGTFNGGVALVDLKKEKLISLKDKRHSSYVSSVCTLSTFDDKLFCSISADSIVVWQFEDDDFQELMEIPCDFTLQGDYKWWEVMELRGIQDPNESDPTEAHIAASSSKDSETRIYKINLEEQTTELLHRIKQKFHPRAMIQLFESQYIVSVGLVDDVNSLDGGLEIIDFATGKTVQELKEDARLCSVATLKLKADIEEGVDNEYLFCGTSERKLIQYKYANGMIMKQADIESIHKKSIFGLAILDEGNFVSSGLDGKLMAHTIPSDISTRNYDAPGFYE